MHVSSDKSTIILIFFMARSLLIKMPRALLREENQAHEALWFRAGAHDQERLGFRMRATRA